MFGRPLVALGRNTPARAQVSLSSPPSDRTPLQPLCSIPSAQDPAECLPIKPHVFQNPRCGIIRKWGFADVINWLRIPKGHPGFWVGLTPRPGALLEAGLGDTQRRMQCETAKGWSDAFTRQRYGQQRMPGERRHWTLPWSPPKGSEPSSQTSDLQNPAGHTAVI